jgi:HCOMODA/2-hydroxy-3-carboxy-muconic semialdehyde decarboxylase
LVPARPDPGVTVVGIAEAHLSTIARQSHVPGIPGMNDVTQRSLDATSLAASVASLDRALVDDIVAANRTLAHFGVLDAFGHISMRDPRNASHYLIACSTPPELVTAADIIALDLDSQTIHPEDEDKLLYRERFIHGEIYKARPDVNAIVHSHSPTVVPFTVTRAKLKPLLHNAGFLGLGAPLFEIRKTSLRKDTDLMILTPELGRALARTLGREAAVVLMRGHGDSVVAPTLPNAVFRAYYTEINARQQLAALTIGGPINFLTKAEALTSNEAMLKDSARPWALWRSKALRKF